MKKPIYILGTGLSHDGSSCLMKDGKIIVAIEKERLSRKKHDGYNDNLTIQYCLDAAGITFNDIDLIVEKNTINLFHDRDSEDLKSGRNIPEFVPRIKISHHIAHAYSAVGTSEFDEMGVIVMDGRGASLDNCIDASDEVLPIELRNRSKYNPADYFEKESYYVYEKGVLTPVFKDYSRFQILDRNIWPFAPNDMEHSIAELYGAVSQYIFINDFTEGKLMGLAPYGRKGIYADELFLCKNNRVFINYEVMKKIDPFKNGRNIDLWKNFQYFADIAKWMQDELERAVFYLFNAYYKLKPMEKLAFAGGLALNAVCNAKLKMNTLFKDFYFQPAASDNGLAIGCCYYGWIEVMKKEKIPHSGTPYLGRGYSESEIEKSLSVDCTLQYIKYDNIAEIAVEYILSGEPVAWYQDGSEFGPRALGHRSIIADPRLSNIKDYINREIKLREEFRPFAPSVLEEDANMYFESDFDKSPYMILVSQVRGEWKDKLPAVTHIDGSARVQTVNKEISPKYYELLNEMKKKTGISILLNTSLNKRGMPIVETPADVIDFFMNSKLEVLVINDYLITKKRGNRND